MIIMTNLLWQIRISHPDYCPNPQTFAIDTDQLTDMTRHLEFSKMIDGSYVLGGLISAVEALQDQTS